MKVVVISGGIGSGKSTVCNILKQDYGWPVYEADIRVKELYRDDPTLLPDIEKALETSFRDDSGNFQPSLLASRIFTDPESLSVVESLVFPALMKDFSKWKEDNEDKDFVILESATILEKPELAGMWDLVVVVDAPVDIRVERAMSRGSVSRENVLARVANQMLMNDISRGIIPDEVDYVIDNGGTQEDLMVNLVKCVDFLLEQMCYSTEQKS